MLSHTIYQIVIS